MLDTRDGAAVAAGSVHRLPVTSAWNLPAGASTVALNVTVTEPTTAGYVSVFPCGNAPDASVANFGAGETVANMVLVPIPANAVCISTTSTTHLVVDLNGSFAPSATDLLHPMTPVRLIDTRQSTRVEAGGTVPITVRGTGLAPNDATAVVVNVTADRTVEGGYVTLYPCGTTLPVASNLNLVADVTVANQAVVKVGANGTICAYSSAATDLIVDLAGAFTPSSRGSLVSMVAGRLSDSRRSAKLGAGTTTEFAMVGSDKVPTGATAVALNVTVTGPTRRAT